MDEDRKEQWWTEALRGGSLREPPDGVLRRAIAAGERILTEARAGRRSWVELLFDSHLAPQPAGVRGPAVGERRLLYQLGRATKEEEDAAASHLDLQLRREAGGGLEITGQLLPPQGASEVEVRAGRTRRRAAIGGGGEFLIRGVPAKRGAIAVELFREGADPIRIDEVPTPNGDGGAGD